MKRFFLIILLLFVTLSNTVVYAGNTTEGLKVVIINCKNYPVTFYLNAKNGVFSVTLNPGQQSCFGDIVFASDPYENISIYASSNQDSINTSRFYVQWHSSANYYEIMPTGGNAAHSTVGSMTDWYSVIYTTGSINKSNLLSWKPFADINGDPFTANYHTNYNCSNNGTVCTMTSSGVLPNEALPADQQALFFAFGNTNMPNAATISWKDSSISPKAENTTIVSKSKNGLNTVLQTPTKMVF